MKKKWITKSEILKLLKTYSIRKDEFQPVGESGYFFQSQIIKGYMIKISQDTIEAPDYFRKTGRIIVSHTQSNGKRTYVDVWERDRNDNLQFRFRNLWNQPLSDADYIKDLKKENEQLIQAGRKLQEQLATIQHEYNVSHELIIDTNNEEEVLYLRQQINDLEKKYQQLKNDTHIHNARGAGRKPSKERLHSIDQVKNLLDSGCSDQDIMNLLKISRATFYRYKRSINN
jgi:hypothetical protein